MVVGDDIAVGRDQEARAERGAFTLLRLRSRLAAELAEKALERRAGERVRLLLHGDRLLGRDVDDGRLELGDHVGKAHRRAGTRGDRLDRTRLVLRDLRGAGLQGQGGGRAAEEERTGNGVGVTHWAEVLSMKIQFDRVLFATVWLNDA